MYRDDLREILVQIHGLPKIFVGIKERPWQVGLSLFEAQSKPSRLNKSHRRPCIWTRISLRSSRYVFSDKQSWKNQSFSLSISIDGSIDRPIDRFIDWVRAKGGQCDKVGRPFLVFTQDIPCVRSRTFLVFEAGHSVCSKQEIACVRSRTFLVFGARHSLCLKQDILCVAKRTFRVFQSPTKHMPLFGEFSRSSQDLVES